PRLALLERVAAWSEKKDGDPVRMVVHFDPNRPVSDGTIIFECLQRLIINGLADGLVGVRRQGEGGARWMEKDGWLVPGEGTWFETGELYVIRPDFLHRREPDWRGGGHWLPYDLDAARPGGSLY
ncbi:MAG: hypothetical protein JO102_06590, partial [Elusimicrobia bacterium]|nr:hypothetical protein [Elusimicrobiota bacterium]